MIVRNASRTALLTGGNVAGQRPAIAHDRADPTAAAARRSGKARQHAGHQDGGIRGPSRQDRPGRPIGARPIYQAPPDRQLQLEGSHNLAIAACELPYLIFLPANYRPPVSPVKPDPCVVSVTRGHPAPRTSSRVHGTPGEPAASQVLHPPLNQVNQDPLLDPVATPNQRPISMK